MKKPKILSVKRTDEYVKIRHEAVLAKETKTVPDKAKPGETRVKEATTVEGHEITAHEEPLPAFDKALQKLKSVVCSILDTGADWREGIEIVGFSVSHANTGVRTVVVSFAKDISKTDGKHPMKTPAFQIDDGKSKEDGRRQCSKEHADDVEEAIKQAQRYVAGERSQTMLNFKDDPSPDEADLEESKQGTLLNA